MPLVVEDGSVVPNADSYVSIANAIAYLTSRGEKTFAQADTPSQEAALRNATDFMVSVYRNRWAGYRKNLAQPLDWPRSYVPINDVAQGYGPGATWYDASSVPPEVQQACASLAVRALVGPLSPDVARVLKNVKIGPISVEYDPNAAVVATYVAVTTRLRPYLAGNGMLTTLVRT